MLTFGSSMCSVRLTGGTTYGPTAAGVRSTARDAGLAGSEARCRVHVGRRGLEDEIGELGWREQPVDALGGRLEASFGRASARPSLAGSTPIIQRGLDARPNAAA